MREITVSSISYDGGRSATIAQAREQIGHHIRQAGCEHPDLIVLPEVFYAGSRECAKAPGRCFAFPEPVDGPTVSMMAALASEYSCYLTVPMVLDRGHGRRTNSAVLLDRRGQVAGIYDKYCPTIGELQVGFQITPGPGAVTFDTDFGRVGTVICYDLNFHELRQQYLERKTQLLLFPSMFSGGLLARTWAILNHCYLVSAYRSDGSAIIDPLGRVLGESAMPLGHILTRRINLDYVVMHVDRNHLFFEELQRRFGGRYTLDVLGPEAICLLHSRDSQVSAAQMCQELKLEELDSFFARSRQARDRALRGQWTPLQPPSWPE